jgi:hypothetical protein
LAVYFLAGWFLPAILPRQIRSAVIGMPYLVWSYAAVSVALLGYLAKAKTTASQSRLYIWQSVGLCVFLLFIVQMMIRISPNRSAKSLAEAIRPRLTNTTQVVLYDTYLAGTPFYLQSERPVWLVTYGRKKRTFLGNYYAIGKRADPLTPWGKAIIDFEEFKTIWQTAKQPLLIIVKEKNLSRLEKEVGESLARLAAADDYLVVAKP